MSLCPQVSPSSFGLSAGTGPGLCGHSLVPWSGCHTSIVQGDGLLQNVLNGSIKVKLFGLTESLILPAVTDWLLLLGLASSAGGSKFFQVPAKAADAMPLPYSCFCHALNDMHHSPPGVPQIMRMACPAPRLQPKHAAADKLIESRDASIGPPASLLCSPSVFVPG